VLAKLTGDAGTEMPQPSAVTVPGAWANPCS